MIKTRKIVILSIMVLLLSSLVVTNAYAGADSIFKELAERIGSFASGFRKIALVMGAFGLVMFTFMAISGKINFKHLGYIAICLFILGGLATFITQDTGSRGELPSTFNTGQDSYTVSAGM